jgi:acyl-CoA reductase-like NAD-dependent aldehyde dehydrogenase
MRLQGNEATGARLLIDGKLTGSERTFPSVNPATGETLGHAPDATRSAATSSQESEGRWAWPGWKSS